MSLTLLLVLFFQLLLFLFLPPHLFLQLLSFLLPLPPPIIEEEGLEITGTSAPPGIADEFSFIEVERKLIKFPSPFSDSASVDWPTDPAPPSP